MQICITKGDPEGHDELVLFSYLALLCSIRNFFHPATGSPLDQMTVHNNRNWNNVTNAVINPSRQQSPGDSFPRHTELPNYDRLRPRPHGTMEGVTREDASIHTMSSRSRQSQPPSCFRQRPTHLLFRF